ncbi:MAG: hypothetical protein Q3966_03360 [Neisseria sp.]|nr:hypothetical protein [Neisseria sp.]
MNGFNRFLMNLAAGGQDDGERQVFYERAALCFVYLYWFLPVLFVASLLFDWKWGAFAVIPWFFAELVLHGGKVYGLSDVSVYVRQGEITRENAARILQRAKRAAWTAGLMPSVCLGLILKYGTPNVPFALALPFLLLLFAAVFWAVYGGARKAVKRAWADLDAAGSKG